MPCDHMLVSSMPPENKLRFIIHFDIFLNVEPIDRHGEKSLIWTWSLFYQQQQQKYNNNDH